MKKIEVIGRQIKASYRELNCIFRFDVPTVMKNDADTMSKFKELVTDKGYGFEGTTISDYIITKNIICNPAKTLNLAQTGNFLISKYIEEKAIVDSYALNDEDKMLCASWNGTTWTLGKV